jgi:hypothetical protein
LLVGGDHEVFGVHQGLLCRSSSLLKNAMKPEWQDKREDPACFDLTQDEPEPVALYVRWLYHSEVQIKLPKAGSYNRDKASPELQRTYISLAQAYVFGERIIDIKYKNEIMLRLLEVEQASGWTPGPEAAAIIYEGSPARSPMRRLISDLIANNASAHLSWVEYFDNYPRDLLADATKAMATLRPPPKTHAYRPAGDRYLEKEEA